MKFLYEYRTKDNAVHSGVVSASTRDAAFAVLKAKGIRPSRLADAPGFFNILFGRGKRWLAIAALALALVAAFAAKVGADRRAARTMHDAHATMHIFDSRDRRQPIGDDAVIEKGIRTGWADVFSLEGDRFLASFAIPGVPPAIRSTTVEALAFALTNDSSSVHALSSRFSGSIESRQIAAMVKGMKLELKEYLAAGGTIASYGRRLVRRQEEEIAYYNRAKSELDSAVKSGKSVAAIEALWEERNAHLRTMGIKPLPMPE